MPGPIRRTRRRLAVATAAVATAVPLITTGTASALTSPPVEVIVQLTPDTGTGAGRLAVTRHGGQVTGDVRLIHGLVARIGADRLAELRTDPAVRGVSRNHTVSTRSNLVSTKYLQTAYPFAVATPDVWNYAPAVSAMTGRGVGVAVIDTGVAGRMPDFRVRSGEYTSRVVGSAVINPHATTADDTFGHGTHVAGIIAGNGNNRGDWLMGRYIGVAPEADLVSVKVSDDSGVATVLDVIYGLQFVVDHKADYNIRVVNLSLTSTATSSATTDPLDAATEAAWNSGLVVVAAAGNGGSADGAIDHAPANDPYIITVGALDDRGTPGQDDDIATSWTSRGVTVDGHAKPDIYAPGARIVSTLAPGSAFSTLCASCVIDGQYIRAGGTSMAAPMVSGVAALMLQRRPWLTPNQVKGVLLSTAGRLPTGQPSMDALRAVYTTQAQSANADLTPSTLLDPATGLVDPARSSWSRSSWSIADPLLSADWARSSWSCDCSLLSDGTVDPSRSSWSRSSWSTSWAK